MGIALEWRRRAAAGVVMALSVAPASELAGDEEPAAELDPAAVEFFETNIRPVLARRCYSCHSSDRGKTKGGLALDTPEGLRRGGDSGEPAVRPEAPEASRLLLALRYTDSDLQMPPDEKLPEDVIADFEAWIAGGAPDPRATGVPDSASGNDAEAATLWSLRLPRRPELPEVDDDTWAWSPVDRFVLRRLEDEGLRPVQDAGPRSLIRRLHFDLIGLPPAPGVTEAFAEEPTRRAYELIVDRLLASPRFGERWGRHWLDVARYAESSGKEFNFTYPHAWPYRDYVIDAFNADKPYDEFVREQIAGDLLPAASRRERDEQRVATGFLAVGPKRHNAGGRTFRMDLVDDQIKATSKAFLGLTVGCARCHDHKFDPIPTEDYYALAGIFLSTETLYGTVKKKYSRHPSGLVAYGPEAAKRHEAYQAHRKALGDAKSALQTAQKKIEELEKKLAAAKKEAEKAGEAAAGTGSPGSGPDGEDDGEGDGKDGRPAAIQEELAAVKAKASEHESRIEELRADPPAPPRYAMGAREAEKPTDAHVAIGGNPRDRADQVSRGFLDALPVDDAPAIDPDTSGRLALARWITHPGNPLTARVIVNRVWQHLFGEGLVRTVDNFGRLGKKPTHPELLDHLALRFVEEGWSIKRLIRTLVRSRTYHLATHRDRASYEVDPDNRLLWRMRPRRLEVEPLRDAVLAVAGQLDLRRPEGSSVTGLGQKLARGFPYEKINPGDHRRTVYLPVVRHYLPHMLQEFDFAAPSLVFGRRAVTTVPAQALFLLNSDFMLEQSAHLARRLLAPEGREDAERIRRAYRLCFGRPPGPDELSEALAYLEQAHTHLEGREEPARRRLAWASFCQALLASAEFRYLVDPPPRSGAGGDRIPVATRP